MVLRLEQVPGITPWNSTDSPQCRSRRDAEYEILLDATASRHCLVLEVETPDPADSARLAMDWGHVSLIIRAEGTDRFARAADVTAPPRPAADPETGQCPWPELGSSPLAMPRRT